MKATTDMKATVITARLDGKVHRQLKELAAREVDLVKIWIDEARGQIGPEYQLLDDARHTNGLLPKTSAGSIYDVLAPKATKRLALVGAFNHSRIHARAGVLEYYLNGELLLRADLNSPEWQAARAKSKFRNSPVFGIQRTGRILLQDHGDEIWFRSIKLRPFED